MICKFKIILIAILFMCSGAEAGKFSGESFSLGVGARGLAMGGAVIAGPFDGTASYWNPAGMNYLNNRHIVAMHAETFGSLLNHDYVAYIDSRPREKGKISAFGFYFYYLSVGGIKSTQLAQFNRPFVVLRASAPQLFLAASPCVQLHGRTTCGVDAKIIYRDIGTESGQGLTMDAGLLYQAHPSVRFGLMISDVTSGFIRYGGGSIIEPADSGGQATVTKSSTESIFPTVKPGLMIEKYFNEVSTRFAASDDLKF